MSDLSSLKTNQDSAENTKLLFNNFFGSEVSYPSVEVDAVVGFFEKRGFGKSSAYSVASVILQKAKQDKVKVFELLDTLKYLDKVKLSNLVLVILNSNRSNVSKIGYRQQLTDNFIEARNILDIDVGVLASSPSLLTILNNFSNSTSTFDLNNVTWDGV